ncbi:hypothetical protein BIW11_01478, partial [Tropilaelaps mercedesae]
DDFDLLDAHDRRSNSLQITRNRSPIAPPEQPSSLPLPVASQADSHIIKKKKKRKAPAPPPLDLAVGGATSVSGVGLHAGYYASAGVTESLGKQSSSSGGGSTQRRFKKKAPLPPRLERETGSSAQTEPISTVAEVSPCQQENPTEPPAESMTPSGSPRLNDLSRIDEDTESDFEYVLKRSDSKERLSHGRNVSSIRQKIRIYLQLQ